MPRIHQNPRAKGGAEFKWTEKRINAVCKKIENYCRECEKRTPEIIKTEKAISVIAPTMPTLSECFAKNRINSYVVRSYEKDYPRLERAIKKVKDLQERFLIRYGLSGGYNSTAFIFTAKNVLGWKDVSTLVDNSVHTTNEIKLIPPKEQKQIASNGRLSIGELLV